MLEFVLNDERLHVVAILGLVVLPDDVGWQLLYLAALLVAVFVTVALATISPSSSTGVRR